MANFHILTNNPKVLEKYPSISTNQPGTVEDLFLAVRDAVHMGAVLISHPLAGSLKPNENPYKSVVLSTRKGSLDTDSLALIESALDVLYKMPAKQRNYSEVVLEDFMVIDLDLMNSAIQALPVEYH